MLPRKMSVGAIASPGIEELLFAVDHDNGEIVIKLRQAEIAHQKYAPIAIGDCHGISLHASSTRHSDKKIRELIAGATLAVPDVVCIVHLAEPLRFIFGGGVLAGVIRVL